MSVRYSKFGPLCAGFLAAWTMGHPSLCQGAKAQIVVFNKVAYPGGWGAGITSTVKLPAQEVIKTFDSLSITLELGCSGSCPPWDFVANLNTCTTTDPSTCTTEMARWVTAYGAGGQWTTQADQMLALLASGGQKTFYFWTPQAYNVTLTLQFGNTGKGRIPILATPLFSGGDLTTNYNKRHTPISLPMDAVPVAAEIYALSTGHGWGTTVENCAEFCDIQQRFTVNGHTFARDEPGAGSATGCQNEVSIGVIANQAGTWQSGRNGWCPGLDVKPYIVDVTSALKTGNNTFSYGAFYKNSIYTPTLLASPASDGIAPSIMQSSYLITWARADADETSAQPPTASTGPQAGDANTGGPAQVASEGIEAPADDAGALARGFAGDTTQTYGCATLSPDFFLWTYLGLSLGLFGRRKARRPQDPQPAPNMHYGAPARSPGGAGASVQ